MKAVFFGTSDRSGPVLDVLKKNFELALCVTKVDTKVGRHQTPKETGVKKWAKENGIPLLEIENLKKGGCERVLDQLNYSKPDFGLVVDFSFLIPDEIIKWFKGHLINVHFSILPKYRGASPVQFAILNGDETTGVTFQLVEKDLDRGAIIGQFEYKIPNNETSSHLYSTLFEKTSEQLTKTINDYLGGYIKPMSQDEKLSSYTFSKTNPKSTKVFKDDAYISKDTPVDFAEKMVRAFDEWPVAWTYLKDIPYPLKKYVDPNLRLKIYSAHVEGTKLIYDKVQVEGKNIIDWKSFENGYLDSAAL